ncbi:hypothetical protein T265_07243 [Opisthorchis viverrini]|uniref:PHD-type domain-containing protein n=1 Tax=Opisthorchis viverrini TaxID=6198 RepID=A0A074ZD90_OPIVI|nr:hypothetical protein T265_07243 [Opisthorchis viverrini]KER25256.1 hypothetical protein T265_07243 [Opisthorchis viverrini]
MIRIGLLIIAGLPDLISPSFGGVALFTTIYLRPVSPFPESPSTNISSLPVVISMTNKCASSSSVHSSCSSTALFNGDLTPNQPTLNSRAASVMHSCSSTLLNRISTDPNSYCAVVADACRFNRGLGRGRISRLPFLDLATQTSQRPAPWLYRPLCERSRNVLESGTHVVLRYMRHRWRLDYQTPLRKRKLAADRLWFTLRTGLTALGIPVELIPLVTKRAYAIAGLPIPPGLAPHLEAMIAKINPTSSQPNGTGAYSSSARTHPSSLGLSTKKHSNSDLVNDSASRKAPLNGREEELSTVVDDTLVDSADIVIKQPCVSMTRCRLFDAGGTPLATGEDSALSADNAGLKRASSGVSEDGGVCCDTKTDDEMSVQSGNGTKLGSNSDGLYARAKYEATVYEVEDESPEQDDEEEEEDEELDDDVEWIQSRGRRSYHALAGGRAFGSAKRRRRSLARRKGSRFAVVGTRLSTRRIAAGSFAQTQRSPGGRQKRLTDRSVVRTDSAIHQISSSRATLSVRGKSTANSSGPNRESESMRDDHWEEFAEPGFQPNANFCSLPLKTSDDPAGSSLLEHTLGHCVPYTSPSLSATLLNSTSENVNLRRDTAGMSSRNSPTTDIRRPVQSAPSISRSGISAAVSTAGPALSPRITMSQLLCSASSTSTTNNFVTGNCGLQSSPSTPYDYPATSLSERDGICFKDPYSRPGQPQPPPTSTAQAMKPLPVKDYPAPVAMAGSPIPRSAEFQPPCVAANASASSTNPNRTSPGVLQLTPIGLLRVVCASRYRSTAGLRYHYHSQHSGYTPKNPISASASRLVVPVGEERGIGGGLRGGRPRRHKGSALDGRGRGRLKESNDTKAPNRANVSGSGSGIPCMEETDGFRSAVAAHDPLSGPERHTSPRSDPFTPSFSGHYMSSGQSTGSSNATVGMTSNRTSEVTNPGGVHSSMRPFARSSWVDFYPNRSLDDKNESKFGPSISGLLASPGGQPVTSSDNDIVELTQGPSSTSHQRANTLQSLAAMENNVAASLSYHPRSQSYPQSSVPISSSANSYAPSLSWASSQDPYTNVAAVPSDQPFTAFHSSPAQRRFERQRCPDRLSLNPPPNASCVPTCVYCLGDDRLNPRLGRSEGLLRCYRCGTWGHFSCLQLPSHVIDMAMRYPWQCIECKTCWVCGSAEQEPRMAFCGDCDRTFHIDCLPNPLPRVPTTHWTCYICVHGLYAMPPTSTIIEPQY